MKDILNTIAFIVLGALAYTMFLGPLLIIAGMEYGEAQAVERCQPPDNTLNLN